MDCFVATAPRNDVEEPEEKRIDLLMTRDAVEHHVWCLIQFQRARWIRLRNPAGDERPGLCINRVPP
jgi:hypothetical protein